MGYLERTICYRRYERTQLSLERAVKEALSSGDRKFSSEQGEESEISQDTSMEKEIYFSSLKRGHQTQ